MTTKKITADDFWRSWAEVWKQEYGEPSGSREEYEKAYSADSAWTSLMLKKDGLIDKVCAKLESSSWPKLQMKREWYTVDALLVFGENLVGGADDSLPYPSRVACIIEHENADDVETEMWKLLHWKCPLKVLIFYDFNEEDRLDSSLKMVRMSTLKGTEDTTRRKWLDKKLDYLAEMRTRVHAWQPDDAAFLFIVGRRAMPQDSKKGWIEWHPFELRSKQDGATVTWEAAELKDSKEKGVARGDVQLLD